MSGADGQRTVLVDASAFITLTDIGHTDLLWGLRGELVVPTAVANEIESEPAASRLEVAAEADEIAVNDSDEEIQRAGKNTYDVCEEAGGHLGKNLSKNELHGQVAAKIDGDTALLAVGMAVQDTTIVSDDKPLRNACKALNIPVSGSIGVAIQAVEQGDLDPEEAKELLTAMDRVGARLSASLVERAERLIDDAVDD